MNVPVNEKPLQGGLPVRLPVLGDNALIAAIAIGFLLLHILTGVLLIKPSAAPPPLQDMRSSFGD
jgi:hypothetical protein